MSRQNIGTKGGQKKFPVYRFRRRFKSHFVKQTPKGVMKSAFYKGLSWFSYGKSKDWSNEKRNGMKRPGIEFQK